MGLGKTVQFIAYLRREDDDGAGRRRLPSLLICPTSVLGNWQKELERFAPSLRVIALRRETRREDFYHEAYQADIILPLMLRRRLIKKC